MILFHPKARAELEESALFYDRKYPGLGLAFSDEIRKGITLALNHPEAGTPVFKEFRRMVIRRFPFSIVYRATKSGVYVIAVAHQKRRQNYWKKRT